ncbi:asparagine synthetase B family protein [Natronorubrum sulfidifaciens]|uniref:hypothetical protein n=1 Tax=Natronorubrum sulfidifaciens TaxID=388259 RepID=UPI00126775DF|nr:hypothetical protein [Natronorubrum sulfidifaciens]
MARFHLTCESSKAAIARAAAESAELDPSGQVRERDILGSFYKKRRVNNQNIVYNDAGDFAASTGTFIYNGSTGKTALEATLESFTGDFQGIQQNSLGHFSLVLKADDTLYVFSDPEHSYDIYYTLGDNWMISSHLSAIAQSSDLVQVDKFRLYEKIIQKSPIGPHTFLRGVNKLMGNQCIKVDCSTNVISVEETDPIGSGQSFDPNSIEKAVSEYAEVVRDTFQTISTAFPSSIGLQLTGGLDSRTILAGLQAVDRQPSVFTGQGDSPLVPSAENDIVVVNQLVDKYNLDLYQLDWTTDYLDHTSSTWVTYFSKYGFSYRKFGCNPSFFDELEKGIEEHPTVMIKGLGAPFPNSKPWETDFMKDRLSLSEFVDNHYYRPLFSREGFSREDEFKSHLYKGLKEYINNQTHIDLVNSEIDVADYTELQLLLERSRSTSVTNLRNEFSYYLAPFDMNPLFRPFLSVSDRFRIANEFQIRLIRELNDTLLDVPVASGATSNTPEQITGNTLKKNQKSLIDYLQYIADNSPAPIGKILENYYWIVRSNLFPPNADYDQYEDKYLGWLCQCDIYESDFNFDYYSYNITYLNRFLTVGFAIEYLEKGQTECF